MGAFTTNLLDQALAGNVVALRELVKLVTPIIQARIARVLLRRRAHRLLDVEKEIEDLCQDVFVKLLHEHHRRLRQWDPMRGMSFENFIGLVAEQTAAATFRKRREELGLDEDSFDELEPAIDSSRTPERIVLSKHLLEAVLAQVRQELTERSNLLFDLLFVDGRSMDDVCFIMDMREDAVRAWQSRQRRRIAAIAEQLLSDVPRKRAGGAS